MAVAARKSLPSPARLAYRRLVVPLLDEIDWQRAVSVACRLADEHRATVSALVVIEVPSQLPLDAHMLEEEDDARRRLAEAEAIGDLHGVGVARRIVRGRAAGEAIVEEAEREQAELIVLRAPRRISSRRHAPIFGRTARFVLQHAPCRVLVSATPSP